MCIEFWGAKSKKKKMFQKKKKKMKWKVRIFDFTLQNDVPGRSTFLRRRRFVHDTPDIANCWHGLRGSDFQCRNHRIRKGVSPGTFILHVPLRGPNCYPAAFNSKCIANREENKENTIRFQAIPVIREHRIDSLKAQAVLGVTKEQFGSMKYNIFKVWKRKKLNFQTLKNKNFNVYSLCFWFIIVNYWLKLVCILSFLN